MSRAIVREAGQQGTEAEVLVGILLGIVHDGLQGDEPTALARVGAAWRPARPAREPIRPEEVRRVCGALREIEARWQALTVGQSLTVWWPREKRGKG